MDLSADVRTGVDAPTLFAWVDDLERYPQWLSIVPRAVPAPAAAGDVGPAWRIDLRGRFGPLARSKRLRMVRTRHEPPLEAVFERREDDGQDHSAWVLRVVVAPDESGAVLTMHLHYGGRLFEPLVERLLRDEIESSRQRLLGLLAVHG